jgi:amino-acid N-acetyltransferase
MIATRIRQARPEDLGRITELLQTASLPTAGIAEHAGTFLVAEADRAIIGAIGLEVYGETGLLRSAVVDAAIRSEGIGSALCAELLVLARTLGVKKLILLTTTAEEYFRRKGFQTIDRTTVEGPVTQSEEFRGACPASAVCMEVLLS